MLLRLSMPIPSVSDSCKPPLSITCWTVQAQHSDTSQSLHTTQPWREWEGKYPALDSFQSFSPMVVPVLVLNFASGSIISLLRLPVYQQEVAQLAHVVLHASIWWHHVQLWRRQEAPWPPCFKEHMTVSQSVNSFRIGQDFFPATCPRS